MTDMKTTIVHFSGTDVDVTYSYNEQHKVVSVYKTEVEGVNVAGIFVSLRGLDRLRDGIKERIHRGII